MASQTVVLDTNIVLDLFVFADEAARPLRSRLDDGDLRWLATASMRDELERVLAYAQIAARLGFYGLAAADVLGIFDRLSVRVDVPAKAPITCKDPDDQKFVDLAVTNRAILLSKDLAVLALTKRLERLAVHVGACLPAGEL